MQNAAGFVIFRTYVDAVVQAGNSKWGVHTQTQANRVAYIERIEVPQSAVHISAIIKNGSAKPFPDWKTELLIQDEQSFPPTGVPSSNFGPTSSLLNPRRVKLPPAKNLSVTTRGGRSEAKPIRTAEAQRKFL